MPASIILSALYGEKKVRSRTKKTRWEVAVIFNVFLGEDGIAGGNPADNGNTATFWQTNTARGAGNHLYGAFARQRFEMFLCRVGRLEAQLTGDISPGGRIAGVINVLADNIQYLLLPLCQFFHALAALFIYTVAVIIYSMFTKAMPIEAAHRLYSVKKMALRPRSLPMTRNIWIVLYLLLGAASGCAEQEAALGGGGGGSLPQESDYEWVVPIAMTYGLGQPGQFRNLPEFQLSLSGQCQARLFTFI